MMDNVTRAILDCFGEEMILLSEDIKETTIISSIKRLLSEECVEFREDTTGQFAEPGGPNRGDDGDRMLIDRGHIDCNNGHYDSAIIESMVGRKDSSDDECSDFLITKTGSTYRDIPNLIAFKPKKRRHVSYGEGIESQERILNQKLCNSCFYAAKMNARDQTESVATKKTNLKLSRWKRRGKRGLKTI